MVRRRRQETTWIHKWSRPIIGAIAAVGVVGTAYLTYLRIAGDLSSSCSGGCGPVLESAWATVLGLPLTLFGCLAYLSMLVLAVAPLLLSSAKDKEKRAKIEGMTWPLLFVGATGMMVFSSFLMYVLFTKINTPPNYFVILCKYCIASAVMSLSMFLLTLFGRRWDDRGQLMFSGAIIAMISLVGTLGMYAVPGGPLSSGTQAAVTAQEVFRPVMTPQGGTTPPVTTPSGDAEDALAKHLTDSGAVMYGAYWCGHCFAQKQLFGKKAYKDIPYVECADDGKDSQASTCNAEGVRSYPTWRIAGQEFPGTQPLEDLAAASGYDGPTDFVN